MIPEPRGANRDSDRINSSRPQGLKPRTASESITVFYIIICRGVVSAVPLRLFLRPLRRLCGFMLEFYFTSRSTSILRPIRSQFYVQFDLNCTSNSTSILRPIRPQFYVQFDLNFTSPRHTVQHLFFADVTELGGHGTPTRDNTIE